MSPEQLNGKLTFKCDIWAFGCVILQFSTGISPYHEIENDVALYLKIYSGCSPLEYAKEYYPSPSMDLVNDNPELEQVLQECFKKDYRQRPDAKTLFNHSFFS